MKTFQQMVKALSDYWEQQGCLILQPYDVEKGAGTFNPATFLRSLGPEPYKAAYIEPCRRPTDGRYGTNPNRTQHYYQYQVILKPSPDDIQDLYLKSLEAVGFNLKEHDIRFVHDDWESPTLGAWGLGWEVWMDGMEITQFTYFQAVAGLSLKPITGEITYGLERLALYLQKIDSFFDLKYNDQVTYGDLYHHNEVEWSHYNFEEASTEMWFQHFDQYEHEAKRLIKKQLPLPAYDFVIKASHAFNILDARGAISVSERTSYIGRIRNLAKLVAEEYVATREKKGFPLMKYAKPVVIPPAPPVTIVPKADRATFLMEIGSEELPAAFVPIGCTNLEKAMRKLLKDKDLPHGDVTVYGTPRRLAVVVKDLATKKPATQKERRGPAVNDAFDAAGKATHAAAGFFRSLGLSETITLQAVQKGVEGVCIKNLKGTDYLFASQKSPEVLTADILAKELPNMILSLDFPKKMRWGDLDIAYARPLHWIVALHGQDVIPFVVGNILSGRGSRGHRQLCDVAFAIASADDYLSSLKEHKVAASIEDRRKLVMESLDALEKSLGVHVVAKERVLEQVIHLVEWPTVTHATFSEEFLKVPKEVLISVMVEHQKYFPVADHDGGLRNMFVITTDTTPTDAIRHGNTKVLSARLNDGAFLYQQDLRTPLEHFNEKLKTTTYLKDLGSIYDKVERLVAHVEVLQPYFTGSDLKVAKRAAHLCKADLASAMVYEFPDLQGVMGKHYALAHGEDAAVASAIDEHWMPRGESSPLPVTPTGITVSLAEKIDNLIGCFGMGLKPTSSSDPYALRRQMLGIIKILINGKAHIPFRDVLRRCLHHFPENIRHRQDEILQDIEAFAINRIKTVFEDYDLMKDETEASIQGGIVDIYDMYCKVAALHEFRAGNPAFVGLWEVYKRAKGQTEGYAAQNFYKELLKDDAEKALDIVLDHVEERIDDALAEHRYHDAYALIAEIQPPLAELFVKVHILDEDAKLRNNRIALLQRVFALFGRLLDFGKIQQSASTQKYSNDKDLKDLKDLKDQKNPNDKDSLLRLKA